MTIGWPRETPRRSYFFIEEGGNITGHLTSATYKASPIPAGDLDVQLLLTFSVKIERIFKLINYLFDYDYTGGEAENNKEKSGAMKKST